MEDLDLNINNYDLDDILSLFKLDANFDSADLKRAYKITLMTHPDKSKLDKKFFLFFSKAFKLLKQIYDFSHRQTSCSDMRNMVYTMEHEEDDEFALIANKIKSKKNFNKWFNTMFEKLNIKDNEDQNGYGSWMKSDDDLNDMRIHNASQMNEAFNEKKSSMRALVKHTGIQDTSQSCGYNLVRENIENYSSDMFSTLQYEDLKKAHTETVVPVTHDDFINRKHFNSQDQLERFRKQNEAIPTKDEFESKMHNKQSNETQTNIQRAYKMAKQMEETNELNKQWWGNLRFLTNK